MTHYHQPFIHKGVDYTYCSILSDDNNNDNDDNDDHDDDDGDNSDDDDNDDGGGGGDDDDDDDDDDDNDGDDDNGEDGGGDEDGGEEYLDDQSTRDKASLHIYGNSGYPIGQYTLLAIKELNKIFSAHSRTYDHDVSSDNDEQYAAKQHPHPLGALINPTDSPTDSPHHDHIYHEDEQSVTLHSISQQLVSMVALFVQAMRE